MRRFTRARGRTAPSYGLQSRSKALIGVQLGAESAVACVSAAQRFPLFLTVSEGAVTSVSRPGRSAGGVAEVSGMAARIG